MGLFQLFKRRKRPDAIITDEMRQKSLETRRLQARINQLEAKYEQTKRLEALENVLSTGTGGKNNMEEMLIMLFMQGLMKGNQPNSLIPPQTLGTTAPADFSNVNSEQNEQIVQQVAKFIPDKILPVIAQLSDADIVDIRRKLLEVKGYGTINGSKENKESVGQDYIQ